MVLVVIFIFQYTLYQCYNLFDVSFFIICPYC